MVSYKVVEDRRCNRSIEELGTHQLLSLIDFQLRTLVLLGVRANRDAGGGEVKLHRSPGLGTWLSVLAALQSQTSLGVRYPSIEEAIAETRNAFKKAQPGTAQGAGTIKKYRDFIFHGGPELLGEAADNAHDVCAQVAARNSELLTSLLARCEPRPGNKKGPHRVVATIDNDVLDLWPLIVADEKSDWLIFGQMIEGAAWFDSPGDSRLRVLLREDELRTDLTQYFRPSGGDELFSDFIGAVKHDLGAFSPPHSDVLHTQEGRDFLVEWVQQTSAGDEPREDRFRIGPDDARQWFAGGSQNWMPYQAYLRRIANWPVLRDRLLDVAKAAQANDVLQSEVPAAAFVEPRFVETDLFGDTAAPGAATGSEGMAGVLESLLEARGSSTEIVFVQGPAGIGKTRALRALAIEQMRRAGDDGPLYLYIQAGSVSLSDLGSLVDAAINRTRILTSDSVRALARNGLLVLIIDGFDELLGGLSYQEPLETLRPWLDALGGRGVMLVSARSAYFFNHYRSSLTRVGQDVAVGHRVFRLEPWGNEQLRDFLASAGVTAEADSLVSTADIDLVRLPFFASVLAGAALSGSALGPTKRIADVLIESYVDREARKLATRPDLSDSMMSASEISQFFTNVAELMSDEGISETDLRFAAEIALERLGLDDRDGLVDRLTSLCALEYSGASTSARFRFEHEIYFDYFYAKAILHQIAGKKLPTDLGLLGRRLIRSWTAELIAEGQGDACIAVLEATVSSRNQEHRVRRANCGALYSALARLDPPRLPARVEAAIFDKLTVPSGIDRLDLRDVEIDELDLNSFSGSRVACAGAFVRRLDASPGSLRTLHIDFSDLPSDLVTPSELLSARSQIADRIEGDGGTVRGRLDRNSGTGAIAHDAREFLERLSTGSIVRPVIGVADKLPNDHRMRWANAKADSWKAFIQELERSGLVELVNIAASGATPMARLTFKASPTEILRGDSESATRFWTLIATR